MQSRQVTSPLLAAVLRAPLAVALAAIVTAIPANADEGPAGDNPEDNYLYVLDSEGINPTNDSDAVTAGYALCDQMASGARADTLMDGLAANAPDLSAEQVEVVVSSAVTWLCPRYIRQYLATQ